MTFNKSQQIGKRGEELLNTLLPMGWHPRKQDPDYHKDLYVEIFEADESTGEEFICSIKTSQNAKLCGDSTSQKVDVSSLKYYAEPRHVESMFP